MTAEVVALIGFYLIAAYFFISICSASKRKESQSKKGVRSCHSK